MSYYEKYLKYKSKYLHLINLLGGGKQSAMDTFLARFDDNVKTIVINDRNNSFLDFDGDPSKENVPLLTNIFEQIYTKVNKDNKNIDWIIKSYINNTFGRPSSLENFGRFTQALAKYKLLTTNIDGIKPINSINGLLELEDFLRSSENLEYFTCIEAKKAKQKRRDERNRKEGPIRDAGINDKEVILETDKIIIYSPTSEAGSKYYGQGTTWCTTAAVYCQFKYYNNSGKLYIIQSKSDSKLKFQLHVEYDDLMDSKDDPVTIDFITRTFSDEKLNKWFDEIWEKTMIDNSRGGKNIFLKNSKIFKIDANTIEKLFSKVPILEYLNWAHYIVPLGDLLKSLSNLQSLTFGDNFNNGNQPLGDSLKGLTNLKSLIFGNKFNQPLGTSLNNLTNLQSLTFESSFNNGNQPLGNLLKELTNLQSLHWGSNIPLGDSLVNLTKLQSLTLNYQFNQPLGDSLKDLTNLQSLTFGDAFNKPLGDSLKYLTNLQSLTFGNNFRQPLATSLNNLTNLKSLDYKFNQPFGDSLNNLTKLKFLKLEGNQSLGDSLKGLINLESLRFDDYFDNNNQPLDDSLKGLTNLKSLTLGNLDQPLGDSLKNLSNLESLTFGDKFNKPLSDSLKSLINLKSLKFGLRFNQTLGDSLKGLSNLEEISFESKFNNGNQPLGDSFKSLIKLKSLFLEDSFLDQSVNNLLENLPNLKLANGVAFPFHQKLTIIIPS